VETLHFHARKISDGWDLDTFDLTFRRPHGRTFLTLLSCWVGLTGEIVGHIFSSDR
jgi:hypothetical protein